MSKDLPRITRQKHSLKLSKSKETYCVKGISYCVRNKSLCRLLSVIVYQAFTHGTVCVCVRVRVQFLFCVGVPKQETILNKEKGRQLEF